MKLNGVILLTDQGEIVENPDEVESVILILDVLSLKILIKEIFTLQFKKIWFFISFRLLLHILGMKLVFQNSIQSQFLKSMILSNLFRLE